MSTQDDSEYRGRVDPAIEELGVALVELGDNDDPLNDDEIVRRAANKLRMLHEMLATVLTPGILKAAMRS
jgi:hypothetical protein